MQSGEISSGTSHVATTPAWLCEESGCVDWEQQQTLRNMTAASALSWKAKAEADVQMQLSAEVPNLPGLSGEKRVKIQKKSLQGSVGRQSSVNRMSEGADVLWNF
ncbi:hypothetical protein E5288_WYG009573 [Bos mutus]|uniref:Uncharacterized protein n=1 Tax=Bos mutus TaxID=72004 RepID=A0A6B0R0M7_9CETA|nr:hypothetical protein [Bos mutus]